MQKQVPVKSLSVALILMLSALLIVQLFDVMFVHNPGWQSLLSERRG